jgi:hypothetical protein
MDYMLAIRLRFEEVASVFASSPAIARLNSGHLTVSEYKSMLRQIFHHTRENPQLQAFATAYFRGEQRELIKPFFRHASSEIGHDQMALSDLRTLGEEVSCIPWEHPLPATTALIGFGYYQVMLLNPIGYLGYLIFLEFTPTSSGKRYIERLKSIGVPDGAMTFVHEHATVDIAHSKLTELYVSRVVTGPEQFDAVCYAMETTGYLYGAMLQQAIERASSPGKGESAIERRYPSALA